MTIVDGIQFPPLDNWIPNRTQLSDTGKQILAVTGGVLDAFGRGEDYGRRILTHGNTTPWTPDQAQLIVSFLGMFPGRAGEQDFQFDKGAGRQMARFTRYEVQVVNRWAAPVGGLAPSLPPDSAITDAMETLWEDGLLVWSALIAMAFGGVRPTPAPIPQDNILIASMTPKGPQGVLAAWSILVEVQM